MWSGLRRLAMETFLLGIFVDALSTYLYYGEVLWGTFEGIII